MILGFPARLSLAFLVPAIPTLLGSTFKIWWMPINKWLSTYFFKGFGVGLAYLVSQQYGINTDISSIGSPKTNVTVSMTNENNPMITQARDWNIDICLIYNAKNWFNGWILSKICFMLTTQRHENIENNFYL